MPWHNNSRVVFVLRINEVEDSIISGGEHRLLQSNLSSSVVVGRECSVPDEVDDLPHTAVLPLLAGKRRLLESAVNNGGVLADMHVCVGTITMARNWAHRNINGCAMVSADVIVSCLVECPDACNWVRA